MKKSTDIFITNPKIKQIKSPKEKVAITYIIPKKENKSLSKEKLTEDFFNYIIKKNSNFINIEKVTEYYEEKLSKNKSIYDLNIDIIKKKKEEIKEIKLKMFNTVINYINVDNQNLDENLDKKKEKLEKEISTAKHELEVYKNYYTEVYKKNYNLNSQLEEIFQKEKQYQQQHDQYLIIKEVISSQTIKQEKLLDNMKYCYDKVINDNKDFINEKQKKLRQLKYELHLIKSEQEQNEDNIEYLIERSKEINDYINQKQKQYLICIKDYNSYITNYIKDSLNMNKIYKITESQHLPKLISECIKIQFHHKKLADLLSLKSKIIINLNSELTSLNNEYNFIIKSIKEKKMAEKEKAKKNIMKHEEYISDINIFLAKIKTITQDKRNSFLINFRLLINSIYASLNLIYIINHSRNISITPIDGITFEKRDEIIKKYKQYFEKNFTQRNKVNFENDFMNKTFLKFLVFLIKELNFQIKSIISNVYAILYQKKKEKKFIKRQTMKDMTIFNIYQKSFNKSKSAKESEDIKEIKEKMIFDFDFDEYNKIYKEELKIKKNKLEERKKFFLFDEKKLFKKKSLSNKRYQEDSSNNNNETKNKNNKNDNMLSMEAVLDHRSADYISKKEFLQQYHDYYNSNNSRNKIKNINKLNFITKYANDYVSDRKEYEETKLEKYHNILIKSKKIKELNEKKEIEEYLKKSKSIKKLIREKYRQNISSDSEKDEKVKKEELALQLVIKELSRLKKPKKFLLQYQDQDKTKIYERYDDLRTLDLNFIKNKKKYLIDSGFFQEYIFKLKQQFDENKAKMNNLKYQLRHKIQIAPIKNKNRRNINDKTMNYFESLPVKKCKSYRNENVGKKKFLLKKINKSLHRNNSDFAVKYE